jgi:hypothetical protein
MITCDRDVVLYFYDEMTPADRGEMDVHVRGCPACRERLDDLKTIRSALAQQPVVDAPPAGDWSGFTRRLEVAIGVVSPKSGRDRDSARTDEGGRPTRFSVRHLAAVAAMLAVVTFGLYAAWKARSANPAPPATSAAQNPPATQPVVRNANSDAPVLRALRENSAQHLERSKLVVLGLATLDAHHARPSDWQYERRLAGSLLTDTRLFRLAAQERGAPDVARVMRDLETVLLEASMSETSDKDALERVQRLISKRDLVSKMQMVAASGAAGL